jgi:hypothetical protein
MKRFLLTAILAAGAMQAQSVSIDLGKAFYGAKRLHGHVTSAVEWRRATGILLASADIVDWRTTYVGVVNGSYCELNPVFQAADGCKLNKPKFSFVKGLILGVVASEEIAPALPHSDVWNRTFTIANIAMAAVLIPVDVSNIHVLVNQK